MTEPLIYTSRGNMLERDLERKVFWQDDGRTLMCHRHWYYQGELVKNDIDAITHKDVTLKRLLMKWWIAGSGFWRKKSVDLMGSSIKTEGSL